jgi:hypothetical protein
VQLEAQRPQRLLQLAQQGALARHQRPRQLLGDGAAARHHLARLQVLQRRADDGRRREAQVVEEALVLRREKGRLHLLGQLRG